MTILSTCGTGGEMRTVPPTPKAFWFVQRELEGIWLHITVFRHAYPPSPSSALGASFTHLKALFAVTFDISLEGAQAVAKAAEQQVLFDGIVQNTHRRRHCRGTRLPPS